MSTSGAEPILTTADLKTVAGSLSITVKTAALLFFVFLMVCSDVFDARILSKIPGASNMGVATSTGTIIQAMFLIVSYIIFTFLAGFKLV